LPDLPTIGELGLSDFKLTSWMGLFAPAGTPPEVISVLQGECAAAVQDVQVKEKLLQLGLEPAYLDATQFGSFLHGEMQTWGAAALVSNGSPAKN
jgi:tripartite-type tricarboxylate transporter receptor subunit TctC